MTSPRIVRAYAFASFFGRLSDKSVLTLTENRYSSNRIVHAAADNNSGEKSREAHPDPSAFTDRIHWRAPTARTMESMYLERADLLASNLPRGTLDLLVPNQAPAHAGEFEF